MKKLWFAVLGAAFLTGVAGCRTLAPPSLFRSGTAASQQQRAEDFDPYPENDVAPAVVGSRPMGYKSSRSEVERAQWWQPPWRLW